MLQFGPRNGKEEKDSKRKRALYSVYYNAAAAAEYGRTECVVVDILADVPCWFTADFSLSVSHPQNVSVRSYFFLPRSISQSARPKMDGEIGKERMREEEVSSSSH